MFFEKKIVLSQIEAYATSFSISEEFVGIITKTGLYQFDKEGEYKVNPLLTLNLGSPSIYTSYSFSAKEVKGSFIILVCNNFFIELINKEGNSLGHGIPYKDGSYENAKIVGMTSIDTNSNKFIVSYASKDNNQVNLYIEEYQIESYSYNLRKISSFSPKELFNFNSNDSFYIDCKYYIHGIFCIYRTNEQKLMTFQIVNKKIINNDTVLKENSLGGKLIFLDNNSFVVISTDGQNIYSSLYSLNTNKNWSFLGEHLIQEVVDHLKNIKAVKVNSNLLFLSNIKSTKSFNLNIQRFFPFIASERFQLSEKGQDISFNPFNQNFVSFFSLNTVDNSLLFYSIEIPNCNDLTIELFDHNQKEVSLELLTSNTSETFDIRVQNIEMNNQGGGPEWGTAVRPPSSDKIIYTPGTKTRVTIYFSLDDKGQGSLGVRSRYCSILFKLCYISCDSCTQISENEDEPKCTKCAHGYFQIEDEPSKCYPQDKNMDYYYFDNDQNIFKRCFESCKTCKANGNAENNNCESCKPGYYLKEGESQCMNLTDKNNFFDVVDDIIPGLIDKMPNGTNKDFSYVIYNTTDAGKEESNTFKNLSTIDLGECENKLKDYYGISKDEPLIILKIDIVRNDSLINQVEYSVYSKDGKKLNLDVCKGTKISILYPIKSNETFDKTIDQAIDAWKNGYDIFNSSDPFYTKVCTPYTGEEGTDIPLEDRKKDYFKNVSLCESNCEYGGINETTRAAICNCEVKEERTKEETMFQIKELKSEFKNIIKNSNLKVIYCYNLVFSNQILYNYGSWFMLIIILIVVALIVWYSFIGIQPIKKILNDLLLLKIQNQEKIQDEKEKKLSNIEVLSIKSGKSRGSISSRGKFKMAQDLCSPKKLKTAEEESYRVEYTKTNEELMIKCSKFKNLKTLKESETQNFQKETGNTQEDAEKTSINGKIYSNEELDEMKFEEAIMKDKRKFCEIYYSRLRYQQIIIFTFFNKTDFNLRLLKISLFFFLFSVTLTFNVLFYSDSTMSRNYHNRGKIEIIYSLPKTIFSSVLCSVISFFMTFLSLSQNNVDAIKEEKDIDKAKLMIKKFNFIWKTKIIVFYCLVVLLLCFIWYFISAFCAVYVNTQKHLFKDTFFSFIEENIFPFALTFFAVMLIQLGIKYKNKCLFITGKIVDWF